MSSKTWILLQLTPVGQLKGSFYLNLAHVRRLEVCRDGDRIDQITFSYGDGYAEVVRLTHRRECEEFLRLFEEYRKEEFLHRDTQEFPTSKIQVVSFAGEDLT